MPDEDIKREQKTVERVREWAHSGDNDCSKQFEPVFTPPAGLPEKCQGDVPSPYGYIDCGNEEWRSKGVVHRIKEDGRIVHREPESK